MEICRGWECAARKGREGALTEVHVRKVLGEIYERTTGEAIKFPTVMDFLNDWVASKALTKSSSPEHCQHEGPRCGNLPRSANQG